MTPETARDLEPGTTPGPWEHYDDPNDVEETYVHGDDGNMCILIAPNGHGSSYPAEDLALIAAAPDMRATIAAQTWEYALEVEDDGDGEWDRDTAWLPSKEEALECWRTVADFGTPRLVRRLVGPVEVAE